MNFITTFKDKVVTVANSDALQNQKNLLKRASVETAKMKAGQLVLRRISGLTLGLMPLKVRAMVEMTDMGRGMYDFALANSLAMLFSCIATNLDDTSETKKYLEAAVECSTYAGVMAVADASGIEQAIDQFLLTPDLKKALQVFMRTKSSPETAAPLVELGDDTTNA